MWISGKLAQVFASRDYEEITDPDLSLYSGGFFSDADRNTMVQLRSLTPEELVNSNPLFEDARLPEMLFRYKARNYRQTLSSDEQKQWKKYRLERLTQSDGENSKMLTLGEYMKRLDTLISSPDTTDKQKLVLNELMAYGKQMQNSLSAL